MSNMFRLVNRMTKAQVAHCNYYPVQGPNGLILPFSREPTGGPWLILVGPNDRWQRLADHLNKVLDKPEAVDLSKHPALGYPMSTHYADIQ